MWFSLSSICLVVKLFGRETSRFLVRMFHDPMACDETVRESTYRTVREPVSTLIVFSDSGRGTFTGYQRGTHDSRRPARKTFGNKSSGVLSDFWYFFRYSKKR
jgi:hypothetical protein